MNIFEVVPLPCATTTRQKVDISLRTRVAKTAIAVGSGGAGMKKIDHTLEFSKMFRRIASIFFERTLYRHQIDLTISSAFQIIF